MAVDVDLLNSNSINNITSNFERVQTALQDAVSRSATTPNQMNADLDMNSNDILNVKELNADSVIIQGLPIGQFNGTFKGEWDSSTTYVVNDVVRDSDGNLWIAKTTNTNQSPTEGADWTLFLPGVTVGDGSITDAKISPTSKLYNRTQYEANIFDFIPPALHAAIVAGTSTDDHLAYLQVAADSGKYVFLPPYRFNVSAELIIKDGTKLVGAGAHWKRRTGYTEGSYTEIFWIGPDAANTAVVRVSATAVGTAGADFSAPGTDDLVDVTLQDIHVNCDNKARYGWYIYRAGNQPTIGNLTSEKARTRNFVFLGCFAARFGHFGAYESESHGVSVGEDLFTWGTEAACFEFSASFHLCNNGTNNTFVLGNATPGSGTDYAESGGIFCVGRGSHIIICSEGNVGRAAIIKPTPMASSTDGPVDYVLTYIEGNGGGVAFDYTSGTRGHRLLNGFIHPGNGGSLISQDIVIRARTNAGVTTADEGPTDAGQWLVLERLFGELSGVGFSVYSNTYKYKVRDCPRNIQYPQKKPTPEGTFATAYFRANSGLTDTRKSDGGVLSRTATPAYRFTFNVEQPDANYSASAIMVTTTVTHHVVVAAKTTTYCELRFVATGALTTPVDPDAFVDVSFKRH